MKAENKAPYYIPFQKGPGRLVEHKDGRIGIIYNREAVINGKYVVLFKYASRKDMRVGNEIPDQSKTLVTGNNLALIGFVD